MEPRGSIFDLREWLISLKPNCMRQLLTWIFSVNGSTVLHNLGLGLGGFLGGLAGLSYVIEWYQKVKRQLLVARLLKKYPPTLENNAHEGWELACDPQRVGHIYILDHRDKTSHWIGNLRTFQDLFRHVPSPGDERKMKLFNEYKLGDTIITVGHPEP